MTYTCIPISEVDFFLFKNEKRTKCLSLLKAVVLELRGQKNSKVLTEIFQCMAIQ